MTQKNVENLVGMLVLLALAVATLPAWKRADAAVLGHARSIQIRARFDDIGGLTANAPVRSAGVPIGHVASISLDRATHRGVVVMTIDDGVRFPVDSLASIRSAGLMGNDYVAVEPGTGHQTLVNGGVIQQTNSALILEDVIARVAPGAAAHASSRPAAGAVVAVVNRGV